MKKQSLIITVFLLLFISCNKYEQHVKIYMHEYHDENFYMSEIQWSLYTKDSVFVYKSICNLSSKDNYQDYYIPIGEYFIRIDKAVFGSRTEYTEDTFYVYQDLYTSVRIIESNDYKTLSKINSENNRVEFVVK